MTDVIRFNLYIDASRRIERGVTRTFSFDGVVDTSRHVKAVLKRTVQHNLVTQRVHQSGVEL